MRRTFAALSVTALIAVTPTAALSHKKGPKHNHGGKGGKQGQTQTQTQQQQQQQSQAAAPGRPDDALPFDDGLVHSHNWASGDYAAPGAGK
jgi:hypothetical protein